MLNFYHMYLRVIALHLYQLNPLMGARTFQIKPVLFHDRWGIYMVSTVKFYKVKLELEVQVHKLLRTLSRTAYYLKLLILKH